MNERAQGAVLWRSPRPVAREWRAARLQRTRRRWLVHLLALVALLALAMPGQASLLTPEAASEPSGSGSQRIEDSTTTLQTDRGAQAQPVSLAASTPAPSPTAASPQWVKSHRPTNLWASPAPDAPVVRELPQWASLRVVGPAAGSRLPVEEPGDGSTRLPTRGWVDSHAIGPADPPEVEWWLATERASAAAPRWQGDGWPAPITAEFAAIVDGDSGELLFGKNGHGRVAPASLTKIPTAIVALERGRLSDQVTVSVDGRNMPESTVMGITPGERLSLETLLYGLMLPSGNDAALAIAQHIGGDEQRFVQMMNELAARLGLHDSHFANPHGLDAPGHYSSPYDMATLARYGLQHPAFADLSAAKMHEAEGYQLYNLNKLLWSYEGADGVKVGYTDLAGRAVVGSATRNGHRVIVGLMRSPDLWGDCIALLDYAFENFSWD